MVPLVKDSLSHCTGLPTLFQRAKCLYLMLNLCYMSMKLQLKTSYTCGTRWVISSIPACRHEHKSSSLLLCHSILLLTCGQFLLFRSLWNINCSRSQSLRRMAIRATFCLVQAHWHPPKCPNACVTMSHLKRFHILAQHPSGVRVALCPVFADRLPSWVVSFSHFPVVWVGPRSQSRWWHSLACAKHWWHQFPNHMHLAKCSPLNHISPHQVTVGTPLFSHT